MCLLKSPEKVLFDVEIELILLRLGAVLELRPDVRAQVGVRELIVDFEVARWDDLENCVPVVLEVQDVLVGLVFHIDVGVTLDGKETAAAVLAGAKSLDEETLAEPQMGVELFFGHG